MRADDRDRVEGQRAGLLRALAFVVGDPSRVQPVDGLGSSVRRDAREHVGLPDRDQPVEPHDALRDDAVAHAQRVVRESRSGRRAGHARITIPVPPPARGGRRRRRSSSASLFGGTSSGYSPRRRRSRRIDPTRPNAVSASSLAAPPFVRRPHSASTRVRCRSASIARERHDASDANSGPGTPVQGQREPSAARRAARRAAQQLRGRDRRPRRSPATRVTISPSRSRSETPAACEQRLRSTGSRTFDRFDRCHPV